MNTSLRNFNELNKFSLGYQDMSARALREKKIKPQKSINLKTLSDLDTLYIVNGPGDLTPLKKFPHLKVLIINYCGVGYNIPLRNQRLDLEPLRKMIKIN